MNRTDCPFGYARDNFCITKEQLKCEVELNTFLSIFAILGIWRFLLQLVIIFVAYSIYSNRKSTHAKRFPWTAALETFHTGVIIVTPILALAIPEIVNAVNGTGPALVVYSSGSAQFAFLLSIIKLVNLGKRILPKRLHGQDDKELSSLTSDKMLLFLLITSFSLQIAAFAAASASIIYGDSVLQMESNRDLSINLSFLFTGLVQLFGAALLVRHTFRITNYMKQVASDVDNDLTNEDYEMKRARIRMQRRAWAVSIVGLHSVIYFYAIIVEFRWYFFFISWLVNVFSVSVTMVGPFFTQLKKNKAAKDLLLRKRNRGRVEQQQKQQQQTAATTNTTKPLGVLNASSSTPSLANPSPLSSAPVEGKKVSIIHLVHQEN